MDVECLECLRPDSVLEVAIVCNFLSLFGLLKYVVKGVNGVYRGSN